MDFTKTLLSGIKTWAEGKFSRLNKELSMKQPKGDYVLRSEIPELESGFVTEEYVDTRVASLINSAPDTLDTLNELAQALGEDPNFATTIANQLGNKVDKVNGKGLSTNDYTDDDKNKLTSVETAVGELNTLVGDESVSDQINAAMKQSDWDQSNENSPDYIKNKPFGIFYSKRVLLPSKTYEIGSELNTMISFGEDLYYGYNYIITFNGLEYECSTRFWNDRFLIGNGTIYGDQDSSNDEPFLIWTYGDSAMGLGDLHLYVTEPGEYTVSIEERETTLKKIEERFLPDIESGVGQRGDGYMAEVFNGIDSHYATGTYSHAEGEYSRAEGDYSHAEGAQTEALGEGAHSEGGYTVAKGLYSHAEGEGTIANDNQHVEGKYNIEDKGNISQVEVYDSISIDFYEDDYLIRLPGAPEWDHGEEAYIIDEFEEITGLDVEEGDYIIPCGWDYMEDYPIIPERSTKYFHVQWLLSSDESSKTFDALKYYYEEQGSSESKYVHIIGNGHSNQERSNAHTLDWEGNAWFQGDVYISSTSGTNRDEGSKKLATEDYVNEAITSAGSGLSESDINELLNLLQ